MKKVFKTIGKVTLALSSATLVGVALAVGAIFAIDTAYRHNYIED